MNIVLGVLLLLLLPVYVLSDIGQARWLPWWRRYAPSVLILAQSVAYFIFGADDQRALRDWLFWIWLVAYVANRWTSSKNNRNRKDHEKLEAETRLTEVQQRSFRREVAEARA